MNRNTAVASTNHYLAAIYPPHSLTGGTRALLSDLNESYAGRRWCKAALSVRLYDVPAFNALYQV